MISLRDVARPGMVRPICNLCGSHTPFGSITDSIGAMLVRHGFPYDIDDFETLNHRAYLCTVCGASDRDRLYKLYLDEHLADRRAQRAIHFAPSQPLDRYLRRHAAVTSNRTADLFMKDVDDVVDLTNMSEVYADGSCDLFICSHVLEHVSDDRLALAELFRILAPGGRGIVMTPIAPPGTYDEDVTVTDPAERWRRFAQNDHVRLYDRATLTGRAREAGFGIETLGPRDLGRAAFWRYGITFGSRLYVVSKGR